MSATSLKTDERAALRLQPAPRRELEDYETIHAAVMETARGRWFLHEYARRNRHADTSQILDALARLEASIERQKADTAALEAASRAEAAMALGGEDAQAIASALMTAATAIRAATGEIRSLSWSIREVYAADRRCDGLDRRAADIVTCCEALEAISRKLQTAAPAEAAPLPVSAPAEAVEIFTPEDLPPEDLPSEEILEVAAEAPAPSDAPIEQVEILAPRDPLAPVMALSDEERLAIFT